MKGPAPHNEKQRKTIASFRNQLKFQRVCYSNSAGNLTQTSQVSKAVNAGTVPITPAGLQRITSHRIESDEFEAFVAVAHPATAGRNTTEHIRLAAARGAWASTPQHFKL